MSAAPYAIKIDEYKPELEAGPSSSTPATQARKSDRACDFCRRRKTRCDGAPTLNAKCTNCKKNQCPCTYLEASRPRGPPKAYVTALEDRIERFERLFKRLRPDTDFADLLGPPIPRGSWRNDQDRDLIPHSRRASDASSKTGRSSSGQHIALPTHASLIPRKTTTELEQLSGSDNESFSSDEECLDSDWSRWRLKVRGASHMTAASTSDADSPAGTGGTGSGDSPAQDQFTGGASSAGIGSHFGSLGSEHSARFLGKSSLFRLIKATRSYMRDTAGDDGFHERGDVSEDVWSEAGKVGVNIIPRRRRQRFWTFTPWEEAWEGKRAPSFSGFPLLQSTAPQEKTAPIFDFPSSEITLPLLSLYFHHTNTIFPLLHAPTFWAQFRDGLHLHDAQLAGVVWAMMAVASRWSEDRRVLWDGWGSENIAQKPTVKSEEIEWASAGWRFFLRSLDGSSFTVTSLDPPSLFDLQFCSLGAMFLRGSSVAPAGWVVVGSGLRKAMDVGAHRKKVYSQQPSVENELWKRAFWMLVFFDRIGSASLGRPCCAREEDFDVDLPLEVDDEYWIPSDPSQPAFKQPEGKPSVISGFISMLKISQINAHALRTIYCIDKSKVLLGLVSNDWQEHIVSQLNAALDEWVESVPKHLRWSSGIDNEIFQNQSATIYTTYYLTLILIYRPFSQASAFIPEPHEDAPSRPHKTFPFPADAICASAAHSATRILDEQTRRGLWNIPNMIHVAHISAVVQLMNMYASQVGLSMGSKNVDPVAKVQERERCIRDIEKCIGCLELAEPRWIMARKFLTSLKSALPDPGSEVHFAPPEAKTQRASIDVPSLVQLGGPVLAPPTVPSQVWPSKPPSTHPTSRVNEAEQALKNSANWRWFHENDRFAQQRFASLQKAELLPLHHHVVVPSTRSTSESPTSMVGSSSMTPAPSGMQNLRPALPAPTPSTRNGFANANSGASATRAEIGRRLSTTHSNIPQPPGPPFVTGQPISSIRRAVRTSTSDQFLSVSTPQSAARDELGAGTTWNTISRQQHQHQQQQATMRVPSHPYATLHQSPQQAFRQGQRHNPERQRQYPSRSGS